MNVSMEKVVAVNDVNIYNDDKLILKNVTFDLVNAEFCYIVGKSGSGKSSFLKTLYGESQIREGSCKVGGTELKNIERKNLPLLRRKLGIIFQDFFLFQAWTVKQNLDYVLRATGWKDVKNREQKLLESLAEVNMLSQIEEKVHNLSGGQQQKLTIARAILNDPVLIIADEPTGSLDPESSDEIIYLLKRVAQKYQTATIFATHDYRLIEKFPARIVKSENELLYEYSS